MKKSRFTDSQIMDALKRVEAGLAVPDLCRELGISTATFYKWRSKYGGMDVSLIARMKELEAENARLRKMYVEEKIKAEIVAEALAKKRLRPSCRREMAMHAMSSHFRRRRASGSGQPTTLVCPVSSSNMMNSISLAVPERRRISMLRTGDGFR